jgi:uncharacterized protein (DUF1800 family)
MAALTPPQVLWNEERAAHLLRRAAFGATPPEIAQAARDGCNATVAKLIGSREGWISAADSETRAPDSFPALQRWWVARMLRTRKPLEERMTFFWHDHFATSIVAVRHPQLMFQQNELFRRYTFGNLRSLTVAVARDPAMLLWLDNYLSRKEQPNENFGRELLELLLLGIGNYDEGDVRAAVRAFTGWTLTNDEPGASFVFDRAMHDDETKSFLGQGGDWNGDDIVRIACRQPAHARFVVTKLFAYFAYDEPEAEVVERLAKVYLDHDTEVRPLVEAILTSPEMYSPRAMWTAVKSPLDAALIACRQLLADVDPDRVVEALDAQGLVLFNPPDIAGWKSGMRWINSWSLLSRMRFASFVAARCDPHELTAGTDARTPAALVDLYLRRLGPLPAGPATRRHLVDYLAGGGNQRGLVRLILSSPEWQLN